MNVGILNRIGEYMTPVWIGLAIRAPDNCRRPVSSDLVFKESPHVSREDGGDRWIAEGSGSRTCQG